MMPSSEVITVGPATEPVDLYDVKENLRILHDDQDYYLISLIQAAREQAEKTLRRKIITQTAKAFYDYWPDDHCFHLPFGTVQSVTSVVYKTTDAVETTWDSGEYDVELDAVPAIVRLGHDKEWPDYDLHSSQPIYITFTCGFGSSKTDVPEALKTAIKLMVHELYDQPDRKSVV